VKSPETKVSGFFIGCIIKSALHFFIKLQKNETLNFSSKIALFLNLSATSTGV
jgi:hypothetical protein